MVALEDQHDAGVALRSAQRVGAGAFCVLAQADLESRKRILQSLLELSHTLAASRDAEAVSEQIVQEIRRGAGFDRVGIYLVDDERRDLRGVVTSTIRRTLGSRSARPRERATTRSCR